MKQQNELILKNLEDIQSLRYLLKTEMNINEPEGGDFVAEIQVYNDAPASFDGGDIVFTGVGLRIIDGSTEGDKRGTKYWPSRITKSRPSDCVELRKKFDEGSWIGGAAAFPPITSVEDSYGEVLFPGESLIYEIKTLRADLPYLDIRVEGSVSRRHLFHISQPMEALKVWTQPIVAETFRSLDAIDLYSPLLSLVDVMPEFGPQTTLADIEAFRAVIKKSIDHVKEVTGQLNEVYKTAPNQKLRDYMKNGIGQFLNSAAKMGNETLEALSVSDMKKMRDATDRMKVHLLKVEEIKREQKELMSQFGIGS